jgi:hypothetical protein
MIRRANQIRKYLQKMLFEAKKKWAKKEQIKKDPRGKVISKEEDPQVPEARESADQRGLEGIGASGNNSKPLRVHG